MTHAFGQVSLHSLTLKHCNFSKFLEESLHERINLFSRSDDYVDRISQSNGPFMQNLD